MKSIFTFLTLLFVSSVLFSQTLIKGRVLDESGLPVFGANVYIKGLYEGTSSDSTGYFAFKTKITGNNTLIISFIGYSEFSREYDFRGQDITVDAVIHEVPNEMNSVLIQASTFGAADSKKAVRLSVYDILTTATAEGDIYGALRSFPGTSIVGEDGYLFVRGGESYEIKTFMDGMLVHKPFTSRMPDLPSRGRFMPMMFSGTMFSTGGYSAEYGQAMSSALILTTTGLPEKPVTSIYIFPFGGGLSKTMKSQNTSVAVSGNYYNMTPYDAIIKQETKWDKDPQNMDAGYILRHQTTNGTMIKSYLSFSNAKSSLWMQDLNQSDSTDHISLKNNDVYMNTTCAGKIHDKWDYNAGVAYTYDDETFKINAQLMDVWENDYHFRASFNRHFNERIKFRTGFEAWMIRYNSEYSSQSESIKYNAGFTNMIFASFAEADYLLSKKVSIRFGVRPEYPLLEKKLNLAPRLSLALQTGIFSQVSFAAGIFYQSPENDYLQFNNNLESERAIHYILNYQYVHESVTFRIEGYYKDYSRLVKYDSLYSTSSASYNNKGYGYARGIDVFFRRNKGLDKNDFWLSYSFLDTKRNFQDYPAMAVPSQFPKHSFSIAYKKSIDVIHVLAGFTYNFATGRTYNDPNHTGFMNAKTRCYNDLSVSASYITSFGKTMTVLHFSISNLLGANNVFGYHYGSQPDDEGKFRAYPVTQGARRFIMLGIFISF